MWPVSHALASHAEVEYWGSLKLRRHAWSREDDGVETPVLSTVDSRSYSGCIGEWKREGGVDSAEEASVAVDNCT